MEPVNESEARQVLQGEGEDVVQPWEERIEVIEAGLDDTTAPAMEDGFGPTAAPRTVVAQAGHDPDSETRR